MPTPEFDIPPKENLGQQLLVTAIVLIVIAIVLAIFAKLVVGLIIFLLGAIAGIGSKVVDNNSL